MNQPVLVFIRAAGPGGDETVLRVSFAWISFGDGGGGDGDDDDN